MPVQMKLILPKDHRVSFLTLKQIHNSQITHGNNHGLAKLRRQYWLIHAQSNIMKIISKGVTVHVDAICQSLNITK